MLNKKPNPVCGEVFLDSIEEIPQPCLRDAGHPGSHRIRPDAPAVEPEQPFGNTEEFEPEQPAERAVGTCAWCGHPHCTNPACVIKFRDAADTTNPIVAERDASWKRGRDDERARLAATRSERPEDCICAVECRATEHDYPPIPDDDERERDDWMRLGMTTERARIVKRLHEYGIPDPVTDSKGIPCEHDVYSWHLCETCAVDQLVNWIEGGDDA